MTPTKEQQVTEREEFEIEWDQDGLAGHAEGSVSVEQCKEIAWDIWQAARALNAGKHDGAGGV